MKITAIQTDIVWENPGANFEKVVPLLDRAAEAGTRLAILPEMFATGFTMDAIGAARHDKMISEFLAVQARRLDLWIAAGLVEPNDPRPRNCCVMVDPEGVERLRYRKIHPFTLAGEHRHYDAGNELSTVQVDELSVTPLVCYDLRFPEPFRAAAKRTDLYLVMANWPDRRIFAWSTLLRARAIENLAYVAGVNRVGLGDGLVYPGASALVDPLGETLAEAGADEGLITAEIDKDRIREVRKGLSFLEDRRGDLYPHLE